MCLGDFCQHHPPYRGLTHRHLRSAAAAVSFCGLHFLSPSVCNRQGQRTKNQQHLRAGRVLTWTRTVGGWTSAAGRSVFPADPGRLCHKRGVIKDAKAEELRPSSFRVYGRHVHAMASPHSGSAQLLSPASSLAQRRQLINVGAHYERSLNYRMWRQSPEVTK